MHATKPLGALAGLLVALGVVGALVALVTTTFGVTWDGARWVLPSLVVVAIVVLAVGGLTLVGVRSREWVTSPYW